MASTQNLVANGDFSKSSCSAISCLFDGNTLVENWTADSPLEIGFGYLYNDLLSYERVINTFRNACITQQLKYLAPGYYQLSVDYTARKNQQLTDAKFSVSLNGVLLKSIAPIDFQVKKEIIDVKVTTGCTPELKICGIEANELSNGAIIKTVKLLNNLNLALQFSTNNCEI